MFQGGVKSSCLCSISSHEAEPIAKASLQDCSEWVGDGPRKNVFGACSGSGVGNGAVYQKSSVMSGLEVGQSKNYGSGYTASSRSSTYWVKRFQCMFSFEICTPEGRGGEKGECKFQNKAHRAFDPINNFTPVHEAAKR